MPSEIVENTENNHNEKCVIVSALSGASIVRCKPVFSPDSKCIFCCSESIIKVLSTESGECIRNLEGHNDAVTGVLVNPNNKLQLLSCSLDQTIIQWDYSDGVLLKVFQFHHPLLHIDVLNFHDQPSLLLKWKRSHQAYDILECTLPTKKSDSPKTKKLSSVANEALAVGCQNKVIALINKKQLHVISQKKTVSHDALDTEFTCVACHPTDVCIVTGCKNGKIYYWYNVFKKNKVVKTLYHWHALPVLDLTFTLEGSYLLSGGYECVLVKWQYNSHQRDYLPRLEAPINHVTCSPDNSYYALSHTDNVIKLITNKFKVKQVYQGLTCSHMVVDKQKLVPAGLHYDVRTKALVTNGKIGHLQFYSVQHDKHLYNLDIVGQNYISPENLDKPLTVTEITAIDFSSQGDWLATVELWDDHVMSPELRLKFWEFTEKNQKFTLNTSVEMPHNSPVTCLKIRPVTGEEDDQLMAVTTSAEGHFKTWCLVDDDNIYRKNSKWMCRYSGYYRNLPAHTAAYSPDGSLLAVGFGPMTTIWEPDTNVLLQTLAHHKNQSDICFIEFGKQSCSHLLVVCDKRSVTVWNLSSCTVDWTHELKTVSLVADPVSDVMAIFLGRISQSEKSTLLNVCFFRPSSPAILYKHQNISSSDIVAAILIPNSTSQKGNQTHSQLPTSSKLYCINAKQQLLCLYEADTESSSQKKEITIAENLPQTSLSLILSKENTKQPEVDHKSTTKDVKSWKTFLETPSQVQPAVTSLCKQFVQSMLVKTGEASIEDMEDEDDQSVDDSSDMEVDEDDSDENESRKKHKTDTNSSKVKVDLNQLYNENVTVSENVKSTSEVLEDISSNDLDWYTNSQQIKTS